MQWCYSITSTSKNYQKENHGQKFLKVIFPNTNDIDLSEQDLEYEDWEPDFSNPFHYVSLWFFFTSEENINAIDNGLTLSEGKGYEMQVKLFF